MKKDILTEFQFLPSLYYFSLVCLYDRWIIESQENYNKGSFRNRAIIKSNTGRQILTVPLKKGKNDRMAIRTVQIADDENWIKPILHKLQTEYGNFPYFEIYFEELKDLLHSCKHQFLFVLNQILMEWLVAALQLDTPDFTLRFDRLPGDSTADFRDRINPGFFRSVPSLFTSHHQEYFHFIPAHSILEALFSYGPETRKLLKIYGPTLASSMIPG